MESFENRRFLRVCDNHSKSDLNTLQFVNVETGQTPEERVAVINATACQGIIHQYNSLISQVLCNPPEITNLNEACVINIAAMISKGEISIKPEGFFTTTA